MFCSNRRITNLTKNGLEKLRNCFLEEMMKKISTITVIMFFAIVLSGCVTTPTLTPQQQIVINKNIPMCFSEKECEAKWAVARKWVINNCSTKIQIYSDDLIETYNPPAHSPELAARIVKEPTSNRAYAISATIWCNNMFGCVPSKYEALTNFNKTVNATAYNNPDSYIERLKEFNCSKPLMGFDVIVLNGEIIIKNVDYNSPANKAGLKTQDIITEFNGQHVSTKQQVVEQAKCLSFGDVVNFTINRSGAVLPIYVTLLTEKELLEIKDSLIKNTTTGYDNHNEIEEKIESIGRLLKKGLISQDEYNTKKAELLKKY